MRRPSLSRGFVLGAVLAFCPLTACKSDPATPEHWVKQVAAARRAQDKVRLLDELRKSPYLTPSFLPALHAQLSGQKAPEVRAALVRAIAQLKDASSIEPLSQAVDFGASDSATQRLNTEVASALGDLGSPAATPTLIRLLGSSDDFVRLGAISSLGKIRSPQALKPLLEVAENPKEEPLVANRAIAALGELGDRSATSALVRLLFEERGPERARAPLYESASFALYRLGPSSSEPLLAVLNGSNEALSQWAAKHDVAKGALFAKSAQVLGYLMEKRAEPTLLSRLSFDAADEREKYFVRLTAADALGRLRSEQAVKPLSKMTDEPELMIRDSYLRALGRIGNRDAISGITPAAAVGPFEARAQVITTLGLLGDAREQPLLQKLAAQEPKQTEEECAEVDNEGACRAIAELVKRRAVVFDNALAQVAAAQRCTADAACWEKSLGDGNPGVRARAALEVARRGRADALPALLGLISDPQRDVRLAALQAVDWLTENDDKAVALAKSHLPELESQLADDRGKSDYVEPNEDLRRFIAKLQRT